MQCNFLLSSSGGWRGSNCSANLEPPNIIIITIWTKWIGSTHLTPSGLRGGTANSVASSTRWQSLIRSIGGCKHCAPERRRRSDRLLPGACFTVTIKIHLNFNMYNNICMYIYIYINLRKNPGPQKQPLLCVMDYGIKNGRAYKRRAMFVQLQQLKKNIQGMHPGKQKATSWNWSKLAKHQMIQYDGKHEPLLQHQPCSNWWSSRLM